MARPITNVSARIRSLEKALEKAALLPFGTVLSFTPMKELVGVSTPVLRGWCNDLAGFAQSGCFERGDRGLEWAFQPVATVLFLLRHFEAERERAAQQSRRVREIVGGDDLAGAPDEMSLDEIAKMIRLNTELQQSKLRDGALIDAAKAAGSFTAFCSAVQQAVLRSAQEQDPAGEWPVEMREKFEDATRTILLRVQRAAQDCVSQLRNGSAAQP
jgi:hypothetical protein